MADAAASNAANPEDQLPRNENGDILGPDGEPLSKKQLKKLKQGKLKLDKKEKKEFNAPKQKAKKTGQKLDFVDETPRGEKKDMKKPMMDQYFPKAVESAWDAWWEKQGYYTADAEKAAQASEDEKFSLVIPPPNVTGSLHLGHALTVAIEDTLVRWNRMKGKHVVWLPGIDHAGIATQNVVEKKLAKEGITRHDLGREEFVRNVYEWKEKYGGKIFNQLRHLGVSVDWSRERFTMDEGLSHAVNESFVRMYEDGLIYRDTRLVNWCSRLRTAVADIEVDHIDLEKRTFMTVPGHGEDKKYEFGVLVSFAYKVDGSDEELVVATTRLETMLGDSGVAVHPDDPRYKHLQGKLLVHPFNGRKLPIVEDSELVDMEFGTGAVKITPAHDPNDYACGKRHNLAQINILNDDGTINEEGGPFASMMRFDARNAVEKALEEKGLLRGKTDNKMRLGLCSRTGDVIEPMLKPQWWVDCSGMARQASDAVRNGDLEILPEFHRDTWFRWLDNIRDWCISRQLWWGHRIPAFLGCLSGETPPQDPSAQNWFVGRTEDEAREKAAKFFGVSKEQVDLQQDEDVLDTWYSSGLFPFSTFGWPDENSKDLHAFYPNSLLETGHDIIFFWVARMVMMGLQLTNKLPFKKVYLHAMIRDKYGRKMSKSRGNVIDPMEVIEGCGLETLHQKLEEGNLHPKEIEKAKEGQKKEFPEGIPECGADALRLGLLSYTIQGRDINLDINRVVGFRNFCNKIWNATRFALSHFPDGFGKGMTITGVYDTLIHQSQKLAPRDKWILDRLNNCVESVNSNLQNMIFGEAAGALYSFWLYELCDVYLELTKPVFHNQGDSEGAEFARYTLYACLDTALRLLHPIMPFVTEELWQRLPLRGASWDNQSADPSSIMVAPYPHFLEGFKFDGADENMSKVKDVVRAIRSIRADANLKRSKQVSTYVVSDDSEYAKIMEEQAEDVKTLAVAKDLTVSADSTAIPQGCAASVVNENVTVNVLMKGLIDDPEQEIAKLDKDIEKKQTSIIALEKKMSMPEYETKVPENVREQNSEKLSSLKAEVEQLQKKQGASC
eukprot:gb/GECG01014920.1/.p1 GENE.gb/GECG01014920.1/~~gb/GECG01014920.1/.p1  ORF type:complete len:1066 (+),score=173.55 gb/GECG01014920.1/:1-3198(+)